MTRRSAALATARAVLLLGALIDVSNVVVADNEFGASHVRKAEAVRGLAVANVNEQQERIPERRRLGAVQQVRTYMSTCVVDPSYVHDVP